MLIFYLLLYLLMVELFQAKQRVLKLGTYDMYIMIYDFYSKGDSKEQRNKLIKGFLNAYNHGTTAANQMRVAVCNCDTKTGGIPEATFDKSDSLDAAFKVIDYSGSGQNFDWSKIIECAIKGKSYIFKEDTGRRLWAPKVAIVWYRSLHYKQNISSYCDSVKELSDFVQHAFLVLPRFSYNPELDEKTQQLAECFKAELTVMQDDLGGELKFMIDHKVGTTRVNYEDCEYYCDGGKIQYDPARQVCICDGGYPVFTKNATPLLGQPCPSAHICSNWTVCPCIYPTTAKPLQLRDYILLSLLAVTGILLGVGLCLIRGRKRKARAKKKKSKISSEKAPAPLKNVSPVLWKKASQKMKKSSKKSSVMLKTFLKSVSKTSTSKTSSVSDPLKMSLPPKDVSLESQQTDGISTDASLRSPKPARGNKTKSEGRRYQTLKMRPEPWSTWKRRQLM